jgi:Flp pilus assembly protein TadD
MNVKRWAVVGLMGCLLTQAGAVPDPAIKAEAPAPDGTRSSAPAVAEVQSLLSSGRQALIDSKWAEAVALFEKARKLEPGNSEADFGLSAAFIELGRFAEALPLLESLRKIAPDNPMVMNNLAWVYVKAEDPKMRNPAKAIKLVREALIELPSDSSIWNTLAEAYYAEGQFVSALRAAESAVRLNRLAGVPDTAAGRELVARCRRAGKDSGVEQTDTEQP